MHQLGRERYTIILLTFLHDMVSESSEQHREDTIQDAQQKAKSGDRSVGTLSRGGVIPLFWGVCKVLGCVTLDICSTEEEYEERKPGRKGKAKYCEK